MTCQTAKTEDIVLFSISVYTDPKDACASTLFNAPQSNLIIRIAGTEDIRLSWVEIQ